MKDTMKDQEQHLAEDCKPAPQLALRTDVHAGADAGCEEGIGYWRKEYQLLEKPRQEHGLRLSAKARIRSIQ